MTGVPTVLGVYTLYISLHLVGTPMELTYIVLYDYFIVIYNAGGVSVSDYKYSGSGFYIICWISSYSGICMVMMALVIKVASTEKPF